MGSFPRKLHQPLEVNERLDFTAWFAARALDVDSLLSNHPARRPS